MGILSSNFQTTADTTNTNTTPTATSVVRNDIAIKAQALKSGMQIIGEVLSNIDGQAMIQLSEDITIQANLADHILLRPGEEVTFRVNSTNNHQIELTPLYTNIASNMTIDKALEEAKLPRTDQTIAMVDTLMQHGNNIDKLSLHKSYAKIMAHPDIHMETLWKLDDLKLPITEENARTLQLYQSSEHMILQGIEQIYDEVPLENKNSLQLFPNIQSYTVDELMKQPFMLKEEPILLNIPNELPMQNEQSPSISKQLEIVINNVLQNYDTADDSMQMEPREFVQCLKTYMDLEPDKFDKLLSHEKMPKILKTAFLEQYTMSVDQIKDKSKVTEYYSKLNQNLQELTALLKTNLGENSSAVTSANHMSENVDFMHQLNQMYSYVQMPLKQAKQLMNSELYVYHKGKNLSDKEGEISAFLHLNTENLGDVDVYVKLHNEQITTDFYVKDDEVLDLLQNNIGFLTNRIEEKGFRLKTSFKEQMNDQSILDKMGEQPERQLVSHASYSFDAKA